MMTLLTTLFLTSAIAEPLDRPLRPTTHPADPALSEGALENFQRVFVDPAEVIDTLKPIEATEGTGHLYIRNEYNGWVDVTVGGTKIGRIQPFTTAALHGVAAGTYDVDISVERVQYVDNEKIATVSEQLVLSPGNPSAAVAADPNYKKPGLQDSRVYPTGKLIGFSLPSVQSAE